MPTRDVAAGDAQASVGHTRRVLDGTWQICVGLLIWGVYLVVTHGLSTDIHAADARGRALLRSESWLHLDVERAADHWLAHHSVLGWFAAWEYALTYIVSTFVVLGWIWWRRRAEYAWARNTLMWTTLLAILCFAMWPTTPPRLLPHSGFVDIVAAHHPFLSWGGGKVSGGADQYAAMPSLHIGWAVWVSVVTLRARATRLGSGVALAHLGVTALVVVGTGNHYILDVVAGVAAVGLAVLLEALGERMIRAARRGERVAAADEFFLQVETPTVQQPVGGFVLLDLDRADRPLDLGTFRALMADRLHTMPRLEQRLRPAGVFRHARWLPADVDLDWHVREHLLPHGGGRQALAEFAGRLSEQRLDRSRPLWQVWFVPNVGEGEASAIAIMHHAIGDGLAVVDILRQLFDPLLPPPDLTQVHTPSRPLKAAAAAAGIVQLAADGPADRLPFTAPLSGLRAYSMAWLPLEPVCELARRTNSRVTDVLLAALGEAVTAVLADRGDAVIGRNLRAAVPMTTRLPAPPGTGHRPTPGNLTAALRLDVPLDPMPVLERLALTRTWANGRRRSGRAIGAAAVVRVTGAFPPALQRLAARHLYRGRHFNAIVSNMPGPAVELSMAGAPIRDVYPIIPIAEGVPLGVGTLGWAGRLCVSVITDRGVLPEADALITHVTSAIEEMQRAADIPVGPMRDPLTDQADEPGTPMSQAAR